MFSLHESLIISQWTDQCPQLEEVMRVTTKQSKTNILLSLNWKHSRVLSSCIHVCMSRILIRVDILIKSYTNDSMKILFVRTIFELIFHGLQEILSRKLLVWKYRLKNDCKWFFKYRAIVLKYFLVCIIINAKTKHYKYNKITFFFQNYRCNIDVCWFKCIKLGFRTRTDSRK